MMRFLGFRRTALGFALETAVRRTRHQTPARLPHWGQAELLDSPTFESVRQRLDSLLQRPAVPRPPVKGHPDPNEPKLRLARQLHERLQRSADAEALALAHQFAAIDMSDPGAFTLLLELISLLSAPALSAARSMLKPDVIAHVSCVARLDRARASSKSFAAAESDRLSQIIIVGSGQSHDFRFDPASRVLTVPTEDSYEHLPSKVIAAMAFLALCGGVRGVLKVDDDHRLNSNAELLWGFKRLTYPRPLQIGQLSRVKILGLHPRTWHFDKTSDPRLNVTPYTLPGTTRWANGANGYYLNDLALRVLLWSYVYFPDYIRTGLYEDMTVSDLIERQGGRIGSMQMERAVTAVEHY